MIAAIHVILNAYDADTTRTFFSEVLGFEAVDAGDGWLIFRLPEGELACHPTEPLEPGQNQGRTELYLMCTDIDSTHAELETRGVKFVGKITDQGYGLMTTMIVPGYGELGLYEPRHPSPLEAFP